MSRWMPKACTIIAACLALAGPALAETFPVTTADPHASAWGERGTFTLNFYGSLNDGTACPPSPNALQYGLVDTSGQLQYLHGYSLAQDIPADLVAAFNRGTFCSLSFDGEARFLVHHGRQATLRPAALIGHAAASTETIAISYHPIMCVKFPCPPGVYAVSVNGQSIQAKTIRIEDHSFSPTRIEEFEGRYLDFEQIEGVLSQDGNTAVISTGN